MLKTSKYRWPLLGIVLVVSVVAYVLLKHEKQTGFVEFTGTIEEVINDCNFDGRCALIVDRKVITTGGGLTGSKENNVYGNLGVGGGNGLFKVGQKVSVRVVIIGSEYTLGGCESCYVVRL